MLANIMFKHKKQKAILSDARMTVSAKHQEMLDKFSTEKNKILPSKKKELSGLRKKLSKLEQNTDLSAYDRDKIFAFKKQIRILEGEIDTLEKRKNENKYHLKTAFLLTEYIKSIENPKRTISTPALSMSKDPTTLVEGGQSHILSFFTSMTSGNKKEEPKKGEENKKEELPKETTELYKSIDKGRKRGEILDVFMRCIDNSYVPERKYQRKFEGCSNCDETIDIEYDYQLGKNVCGKCGKQLDYFYDPQFTSYKQSSEIDIQPEFPYKRINHFFEWLAQFQAKENTDIPKYVFESLEKEFKKSRIYDYNILTHQQVKDKLKKLGLNKFYEHIPYIIHQFNGLSPPVLTHEMEEVLRKMFMEIQEPFERTKPAHRKNFLSYSYVFHKFCQLLELDNFLKCFPLLKSREKLYEQDKIWREICDILKWEFIPSV